MGTRTLKTTITGLGLALSVLLTGSEAAALSAPYNVTARAESSSAITITWSDSNAQMTGFVIQRSLKPTNGFKNIVTTSNTVRSFNDTGRSPSTTYYYRL